MLQLRHDRAIRLRAEARPGASQGWDAKLPDRREAARVYGGAPKADPSVECHGSVAVKTFICPEGRVEHRPERESPPEPALMSIRRDLLLRTALLRQPDMPPLPPLRAVAQQPQAAPPARRATPRRRTKRVVEKNVGY
jgi:hypothetical protein